MPSLWAVFLFCSVFLVIVYLLMSYLKGLPFIRRVEKLIGRRLNIFEQVEESDEDEGIVDDEILFSDLNPEQSVEKYRRMRFDAAAAALRNAVNKPGSKETNGNYEMYRNNQDIARPS